MKKIIELSLIFVFLCVYVTAWTPPSDGNLRNYYGIYNATDITAENLNVSGIISGSFGSINLTEVNATIIYQNGNVVLDTSDESSLNVNSSTFWASVSSYIASWFYAVNNVLYFNDSTINGSIDNKIGLANDSMKSYVDAQDLDYNSSMKSYVDAQDSIINSSAFTYIDAQDLAYNSSMKSYVDDNFISSVAGSNASGLYNISADFFDGNSTWTHQSYPSACSANFAVSEIGDSNTCSDYWVNEGGDTWTGNMRAGNNNISNLSVINQYAGNLGIYAYLTDFQGSIDVNATMFGGYITSHNWSNVTITESQITDLTSTIGVSEASLYANMTELNDSIKIYTVNGTLIRDTDFTNSSMDLSQIPSSGNINVSDYNLTNAYGLTEADIIVNSTCWRLEFLGGGIKIGTSC